MKRAHVYIEGRVQGVGFRHYTKTNARRNGAKGWVKNLPDGRVEAVFEGDEETLDRMIELVKEGPASSRVVDVEISWEPPKNDFDDFNVKYF